MGVLLCYRRRSGPLQMAPQPLQLLVDAVGAALGGADSLREITDQETWTQRSWLHQATGMVLAQLGISADDALALLQAHSFAHDQSLGETASQVLDRSLMFATTDLGPPGATR